MCSAAEPRLDRRAQSFRKSTSRVPVISELSGCGGAGKLRPSGERFRDHRVKRTAPAWQQVAVGRLPQQRVAKRVTRRVGVMGEDVRCPSRCAEQPSARRSSMPATAASNASSTVRPTTAAISRRARTSAGTLSRRQRSASSSDSRQSGVCQSRREQLLGEQRVALRAGEHTVDQDRVRRLAGDRRNLVT